MPVDREVIVKVTLYQRVTNELKNLSQSWITFRDSVASSHRILNNVFFRTFRRLARIRTAIFILTTFLAVRPIFRFFTGLIEDSALVEGNMTLIDERWLKFRRTLAEKLLPIFKMFKERFYEFQLDLIAFASRHGKFFYGLTVVIGTLIDLVVRLGKSFVVLAENWRDSAQLMGNAWKFVGKSIAAGIIEMLRDALAPEKVIPALHIEQLKAAYEKAVEDLANFKGPISAVQDAYEALKKARAEALKTLENPAMAKGGPSIEAGGWGYYLLQGLMPAGVGTFIANKLHDGFASAVYAYDQEIGKLVLHMDNLTTKGPLKEMKDIWLEIFTPAFPWVRVASWVTEMATGVEKIFNEQVAPFMQKWVEKLKAERARRREAGEDVGNDLGEGVYAGLRESFIKVEETLTEASEKMGKAIRDGLQSSLSDYFVSVMEGKFNKFKDMVIGFFNSLKKAIADFVAQRVIQNAFALLFGGAGAPGQAQGGLVGIISGAITKLVTPSGGATSTKLDPGFESAQHGGAVTKTGLVNVHAGEVINPPRGSRKLPGFGSNMGQGTTVVFNVQTIDAPSFEGWLERSKGKIKRVMVEAATGGDFSVRSAFKIAGR